MWIQVLYHKNLPSDTIRLKHTLRLYLTKNRFRAY